MRIPIMEGVDEGPTPYQNLVPVVEALVQHGNHTVGWEHDRDGWYCQMELPIDFDLLDQLFEFPSSILLARDRDGILDQMTWIDIRGRDGR